MYWKEFIAPCQSDLLRLIAVWSVEEKEYMMVVNGGKNINNL